MLSRLTLRDFRCFAAAEVEPHPQLTFLVGRNAQGKTSLLESVCVLMRLQSPRTSSRTDWMRFGSESCLVEGIWNDGQLRHAQTRLARRLAVDGAVCRRTADYLDSSALVVWMDHADMNLTRGTAEHRRRYLDFAAAQIFQDYLPSLRQYERALRARNFLLKRDAIINWRQVDAYAAVLEKNADVIARCRCELVRRLQTRMAGAHAALSGADENAGVEYISGHQGGSLRPVLESMRDQESRTRATAAGVHRDELKLQINGLEAATYASEGQQRTLCLALKLAQAAVLEDHKGEAPLLLMDDIFGELDPERRRALMACLPEGSQKIVTTTSLEWMSRPWAEGTVIEIERGSVRAVKSQP